MWIFAQRELLGSLAVLAILGGCAGWPGPKSLDEAASVPAELLHPAQDELATEAENIAKKEGSAKGRRYSGHFASIQKSVTTQCDSGEFEKTLTSPFADRDDFRFRQRGGILTIAFGDHILVGSINRNGTFKVSSHQPTSAGLMTATIRGRFHTEHTASARADATIIGEVEGRPTSCLLQGKYEYVRTMLTNFKHRQRNRPYVEWEYRDGNGPHHQQTSWNATPQGERAVIYEATTENGQRLDLSFTERPDTPGLYFGTSSMGDGGETPCDIVIESVENRRLLGHFICGPSRRTKTGAVRGNFVAPIPYY